MKIKEMSKKMLALLLAAAMTVTPSLQASASETGGNAGKVPISQELIERTSGENAEGVTSGAITEGEDEKNYPGMPRNYRLSAAQIAEKDDLKDSLEVFSGLLEGEDYAEKEVVLLAQTEEEAEVIAKAYGGTLKEYYRGVTVISLNDNMHVADALRIAVSRNNNMPVVWPNYYRTTMTEENYLPGDMEVSTEEMLSAYGAAMEGYNDPYLIPGSEGFQWQHSIVGSPIAWNGGYTGKGIKVAVLDSGVNPHSDLKVADDFTAFSDVNDPNFPPSAPKENGSTHGTHVAGIIGALNNNGIGGSGIAPDAVLYNAKVLDNTGSGTDAHIMMGVMKAMEWKVDIINMSLGGIGYNGAFDSMVSKAKEQGIAVFAAAGNDFSKVKSYPAAYKDVICVAATEKNNTRADFSNYGAWVDLAAPGTDICSTSFRIISENPYNASEGFQMMSGTSQATPVAAGEAAVILSANLPALEGKTGKAKVEALLKIMQANVIKTGDSQIGKGIVDLPKVLGLSKTIAAPNKPVFVTKPGTYTEASVSVEIKAENGMQIYYSTSGKTPSFKNGVVSNGELYTAPFNISGKSKVTVKAIAVNAYGKSSAAVSASYTLKPVVSGIAIEGLSKVIKGKSIVLKAIVYPDYAAVKKVDWSVEPASKGVTVNAGGKVAAGKTAEAGDYIITAKSKDGSASASFKVTVIEAAKVESVQFTKTKDIIEIKTNASYALGELLDAKLADGKAGTAADFSWSSNKTSVAVVDAAGTVTAKAPGVAKITALAADGSGKKAVFTLTVKQLVTGINITGYEKVAKGKSIQLKGSVFPSNANVKGLVWSVAEEGKGVTVNKANGKVTASKDAAVGTYTIKAVSKDAEEGSQAAASYKVEVIPAAAQKIELDAGKMEIFRVTNEYDAPTTGNLKVTMTGETGLDTAAYEVTSSNPGIVTAVKTAAGVSVSATGKATGTSKVTVAAADGSNKKAVCTVVVSNPATNLLLSPQSGRSNFIGKGKTLKLTPSFESNAGAVAKANTKVKWESSNTNIATVNASGVVKMLSDNGNAVITATAADASGLKASYVVVGTKAITSIEIDGLRTGRWLNIAELNRMYSLKILYNGAALKEYVSDSMPVTCPYVSIEISDPDVVAVQNPHPAYGYGVIRLAAMKKGTTTVKIKALDGSNKSATYKLEVR